MPPSNEPTQRQCPHCGFQNDTDRAFCVVCRMDLNMRSSAVKKPACQIDAGGQGFFYYYSLPIRLLSSAVLVATPIFLFVFFFRESFRSESRFYGLFIVYMFLFPPLAIGCLWSAKRLLTPILDESLLAGGLLAMSRLLAPLAMYFSVPAILLMVFIFAYYWRFHKPLVLSCGAGIAVVIAVVIYTVVRKQKQR
jgi:hypothetical protein